MKFGGTSVGSAQRMKDVCRLITQDGTPNMVVLSAMSGTTNTLVEISDYLYKKNPEGANNVINQLEQKYVQHVDGLYATEEYKQKTLDFLKDNFISASYADGQLTVTTKKSIESYYSRMQKGDGGRTTFYWDKFRSYVDDCYFTVRIEEKMSGISKELEIRFDDTIVTGVNVNQTEMQF